MLGMKDAVFLALSTPLGSDNWLTQAIGIKDENGVPYFPTIQIGLVCDQCLASGHKDLMEQCEHRRGITPPWKSEDREFRIRKITSLLDDPARALRENAATIIDSGETSFDGSLLKTWFENPPTLLVDYVPDKIYITIDPDAGGGTSQCAIVSGYRLTKTVADFPQQTLVVCIYLKSWSRNLRGFRAIDPMLINVNACFEESILHMVDHIEGVDETPFGCKRSDKAW